MKREDDQKEQKVIHNGETWYMMVKRRYQFLGEYDEVLSVASNAVGVEAALVLLGNKHSPFPGALCA